MSNETSGESNKLTLFIWSKMQCEETMLEMVFAEDENDARNALRDALRDNWKLPENTPEFSAYHTEDNLNHREEHLAAEFEEITKEWTLTVHEVKRGGVKNVPI